MDWNPADEFSGPDPRICECCDGSGVEVFGITVYEHGCGFSHDSTDERPCKECGGTGRMDGELHRAVSGLDTPSGGPVQLVVPDDDLPF